MGPDMDDPFATMTAYAALTLAAMLAGATAVWGLLKILIRLGFYTPTGPLDQRFGRIIFLTLLFGFVLGSVAVISYGMVVSMFGD